MASTDIIVWDGTLLDLSFADEVSIWCWDAPDTPYTIECGDGTNSIPQVAAFFDGTSLSYTSTISAVGRYTIPVGCQVALTGGTGGSLSWSSKR